jgi:putative thioredoxin
MPILANLADEYDGRFHLAKVDTDKEQQLAMDHGVRSLPTVKLFKDGKIIDEFMGALPESAIRQFLDRHVGNVTDDLIGNARQLAEAGQQTDALTVLHQARETSPDYDPVHLAITRLQLDLGDTDAAQAALKKVSPKEQHSAECKALAGRIALASAAATGGDLASLEGRVLEDDNDLNARHELGIAHFAAGNVEPAMEQLLEVIRRGHGNPKDAARMELVRIFEVTGAQDERVSRYRRLLAQALN